MERLHKLNEYRREITLDRYIRTFFTYHTTHSNKDVVSFQLLPRVG